MTMDPTDDIDKEKSETLHDPSRPNNSATTTTTATSAPATTTARSYYNSPSTDTFYHTLWGGENIHIGTYLSPTTDTIQSASQRTISHMAALAAPITPTTRVLDIGAGYGGAARWLAREYGCHVTCLNLSEVQNERNRAKNREQGLEQLIEVVDGEFEHLPFKGGEFDLVWCQDCLIHASDRDKAVREMARVLVSSAGARVVLTDHMASADADTETIVAPIKKRLSLDLDLATRQYYQDAFLAQGFVLASYTEGTEHMVTHCGKVMAALEDAGLHQEEATSPAFSGEFIENTKTGMSKWVEGGRRGQLEWGIFVFRR